MNWDQLKHDFWRSEANHAAMACSDAVVTAAWTAVANAIAARCREIGQETGVLVTFEPLEREGGGTCWRGISLWRGVHSVVVYVTQASARVSVIPVPAYASRRFNQNFIATALARVSPAAEGFALRSVTDGALMTPDDVAFAVLSQLANLLVPEGVLTRNGAPTHSSQSGPVPSAG